MDKTTFPVGTVVDYYPQHFQSQIASHRAPWLGMVVIDHSMYDFKEPALRLEHHMGGRTDEGTWAPQIDCRLHEPV